ncbi:MULTISPECIES: PLP-dependent aminotransferase family protein [Enterobacter]|uniref:PLP-dependent aminotransferase family protein n=1 Tax=Enterobacter kobei TaxID=208224 RepID=A0ABX9EYU6_9ENTR|nr:MULTISPECIES: PLP-dependent aminotransferase family protein [Enterobacter]CAE7611273.1 HTH-type transcriptional regulatory protein GabR [Enterobacter cloacae]EKS6745798.1 PLP-dependent aminotransferase family protein [Enterobacter kobei]EKV5788238.1 PLP-dependent aminotransferase family protein [Enterobacter kobei]ELC0995189.1 PLP-dependent aminotransferase family protein [Enterobacter kobei]ELE6988603.1 PLP-dependent aminotransferase family protein [Enterobacter kobei]
MFKHAQLETVKAWISDPANGSLPLHERIQRAIRTLILEGTLSHGKALPASRALATSLNVSRDTVEAAYSSLHAEGFIERQTGRGSFVSSSARFLKPRIRQHPPTAETRKAKLSARGKVIYESGGIREFSSPRPLAPGIPETRLFPIPTWERLQRQVLKEYQHKILEQSPPQGMERLRRAIAEYVNLERGTRASAEQVIVLTSSQQALALCSHVLLDNGESIVIEDPTYQGAHKAFKAAGLHPVPVPLDEKGISVDALNSLTEPARAIYLTPSHQYPTGVTLSLDRRLAVIDWANRHAAWIIEDDYDSEFHYEGKPMACLQGLDAYNRTIYIGTFTKSLFPGLRIAYMIVPSELTEPFTMARTLMDGHTASITQLTLAKFLEGGHFGAYIRKMRNVYVARRDKLASLMDEYLSDYVVYATPAGGMQMPCHLRHGLSEKDIAAAARRADIDILGLTGLYAGSPVSTGFLMGFAAYTEREIEDAVKKLAAIFLSCCYLSPL